MKTLNDYTNQEIIDLINNAKIACGAYMQGSAIKVCYRASKKNIITIQDGKITWIGNCAAGVTAIKNVLGIE